MWSTVRESQFLHNTHSRSQSRIIQGCGRCPLVFSQRQGPQTGSESDTRSINRLNHSSSLLSTYTGTATYLMNTASSDGTGLTRKKRTEGYYDYQVRVGWKGRTRSRIACRSMPMRLMWIGPVNRIQKRGPMGGGVTFQRLGLPEHEWWWCIFRLLSSECPKRWSIFDLSTGQKPFRLTSGQLFVVSGFLPKVSYHLRWKASLKRRRGQEW